MDSLPPPQPPDLATSDQGLARRRSYVARHWHGELPLGLTYWVNGWLLSILVRIAFSATANADIVLAPRLFSFTFALLEALILLLSVWQLVGAWRSAGRSMARRRARGLRPGWGAVIRFVTVVSACWIGWTAVSYGATNAWANLQIAFGRDPTPRHVIRLVNRGTEVAITGGFDFGTSADFAALLDASPLVRTVDLNSVGGRVAEAEHVAKLIKDRHLATYTETLCASACTIAYVAGFPRYFGPGAKLGFHQYAFPGLTKSLADGYDAKGRKTLVDAGVRPEFATRAFATPSSSLWAPDESTLVWASVVTQVVDGGAFSAHATDRPRTEAEVVASWQSHPGFTALRRSDSNLYWQAVEAVTDAGLADVSVQEMMAPAEALLAKEVARYQPFANDDTQVQAAALAADEGQMLSREHPDACLSALARTKSPASYASLLTPDLRRREIALQGRIIDSGSASGGDNQPRPATERDAAVEQSLIWSRVQAVGHDIGQIAHKPVSVAEQRSLCLTMISFTRNVASLPAQRAGALMRYLSAR